MYCFKYQRTCECSSCNMNYRQCETAFVIHDHVNMVPTHTHPEDRIKQLEQEVANLQAENMNLRNRLNANPLY